MCCTAVLSDILLHFNMFCDLYLFYNRYISEQFFYVKCDTSVIGVNFSEIISCAKCVELGVLYVLGNCSNSVSFSLRSFAVL
jgi:hypothetical protein